jgi:hypothetical protein
MYQSQPSTYHEDQVGFNRISINEDPLGAEIEDLCVCSELLVKAMIIREKYMVLSGQQFPYTTAKHLNRVFVDDETRHSSLNNVTEQAFFETYADDGKLKYFN